MDFWTHLPFRMQSQVRPLRRLRHRLEKRRLALSDGLAENPPGFRSDGDSSDSRVGLPSSALGLVVGCFDFDPDSAGLLRRSPCWNHLKHGAFSTPKCRKGSRHLFDRCFSCIRIPVHVAPFSAGRPRGRAISVVFDLFRGRNPASPGKFRGVSRNNRASWGGSNPHGFRKQNKKKQQMRGQASKSDLSTRSTFHLWRRHAP